MMSWRQKTPGSRSPQGIPQGKGTDRAGYEEVDLFIQPVGDADRAAFKRRDHGPRGVEGR